MFKTVIENRVFTLLTALSACLCEEYSSLAEEDPASALCFCGILPGEQVPFDYSDGGMAWVRAALIAPMATLDAAGRACAVEYDVTVSIGVLRCAPGLSDSGEFPTSAEQFDTFRLQALDMGLIHKVISCCKTGIGSKPVIGEYTPVGPDGGAIGGAWTATWRVS
jgi:hypothetical protein